MCRSSPHENPREREPLEFRNPEESHSNYRRKDFSLEYFAESRLAFIDELQVRRFEKFARPVRDLQLTGSRRLTDPHHRQIGEAKLDLAKLALLVAAEDDALTSHSSVKFPVDAYLKRLDALARDFEVVLELNKMSGAEDADKIDLLIEFLFGPSMPNTARFVTYRSKFDRGDLRNTVVDAPGVYESPHPAYLNNVLTRKRGLSANLAIIASDVLRRLTKNGCLTHWAKVWLSVHGSSGANVPNAHLLTHTPHTDARTRAARWSQTPGARTAFPSSNC